MLKWQQQAQVFEDFYKGKLFYMRVENHGNYGFGRHEEPGFYQKLFQMGSAAKSGRQLQRRRVGRQVGNIFLRSQKKTPEVIPPKGLSEKIRQGIGNLNEWAPAGGLASAIVGAIVFDQCRVTQIAIDLKNIEKKVDEGFKKVDEQLDKIDQRFDKIDQRFDKLDAKLDKLNNIDKIAIISFGSYGFTYLLFKLGEARAGR